MRFVITLDDIITIACSVFLGATYLFIKLTCGKKEDK